MRKNMGQSKTYRISSHNGLTGELTCYANNEQVLQLVEPDFSKAGAISKGIQDAYAKGVRAGRQQLLQEVQAKVKQLEQ